MCGYDSAHNLTDSIRNFAVKNEGCGENFFQGVPLRGKPLRGGLLREMQSISRYEFALQTRGVRAYALHCSTSFRNGYAAPTIPNAGIIYDEFLIGVAFPATGGVIEWSKDYNFL